MNHRSRIFAFSMLVIGAGLSGCIIAPAPYYAHEAVVTTPPPAPQVEYIGPPPVVGYVWIGGYWAWHNDRHVWINGHWDAPRAGYRWVPHAWVHDGGGWRMHEGHWDHR